MEQIRIWKAHGDGGERGTGPVIAYCSTEEKAKQTAHKKGWYGSDGAVIPSSALKIDGKVWLLASPEPIDLDGAQAALDADLREKTLAILTAEQIRVLGIKV